MEFNVNVAGVALDMGAIEEAIWKADASGVVDLDPTGPTLRVAASVSSAELVSLLNAAGCPVAQDQVQQLPSVCCGGCGG